MSTDLPSGTVTFLFTDIENSTRLWEMHPDSMQGVQARHDELLRQAVETHQGNIVKTTGDGVHAVFENALDGVTSTLSAQEAIMAETWEVIPALPVRMALHTGEAQLRDGDYYGSTTNRAARLMAIVHGGQIILSQRTRGLIPGDLSGSAYLIDLGEHRLRDLTQPERVFQLCHPALPNDFPPLRSLANYPNNLPLQLNSFVGRERELMNVKDWLGKSRLVSLVGTGGTGKTRLMLQVAAEVVEDYKEGVWLVELASLSDADLLIQRVSTALSVRAQADQPLLETLVDYLRYKHILLLLDNCEHMITASAQLADQLLQVCPDLTIMVTSREGLAIGGEVTYQVPSLSIPSLSGGEFSMEDLSQSEAVQLFTERAQAALPTFQLTPDNAVPVAQICQRLDGIPLAIELAAARLRMFSVDQIADRLYDRFRLLTGGSRTALPRQQTLLALIDWSWNLLSESEQHLLRHLSVFSGTWTMQAAETICNIHEMDLDVFEGLAQLVQKSLVVTERQSAGDVRYRLMESIRLYAYDRLIEVGEVETLRNQHAAYYVQLAEQIEMEIMGPDMARVLAQADQEKDNFRAALEWSLENKPDLALRIVGTLYGFRGRLFYANESRRYIQEALDRVGDIRPGSGEVDRESLRSYARAYMAMSGPNFATGDHAAGLTAAGRAVELSRLTGDEHELVNALNLQALVSKFSGEVELSRQASDRAIQISRQSDYPFGLGLGLVESSSLAVMSGDISLAQEKIDESMQVAQRIGNPWMIGITNRTQAALAAKTGQYQRARLAYERAAACYREVGDRDMELVIRSDVAHLLRRQGEIEAALAVYKETVLDWFDRGHRPAVAHQFESLAMIAVVQDEYLRAARLLGAAGGLREAAFAAIVDPQELQEFEDTRAVLLAKLGKQDFQNAFSTGQLLPVEKVIQYAVGETEEWFIIS